MLKWTKTVLKGDLFMKIRQILALFLALAALLSLSACAKQSDIDRLTEEVAALESEKARLSGENEKLKSDNSALRDESSYTPTGRCSLRRI